MKVWGGFPPCLASFLNWGILGLPEPNNFVWDLGVNQKGGLRGEARLPGPLLIIEGPSGGRHPGGGLINTGTLGGVFHPLYKGGDTPQGDIKYSGGVSSREFTDRRGCASL